MADSVIVVDNKVDGCIGSEKVICKYFRTVCVIQHTSVTCLLSAVSCKVVN